MKLLALLLCSLGAASAAPILYSIGADEFGVPRNLYKIDVTATTITSMTLLGDGSLSYGGGIAFQTGTTFDGLESDSFGSVNRVTYTTGGTVNNVAAAGSFTGGGMANVAGTVHWIANDLGGNSSLTDGATANAIGTGFNGGLAYRTTDSLGYAVQNDTNGNSSVHSINFGTFATTPLAIVLGQGFLGGLAWDPIGDRFYIVGSDINGAATLYSFALGDLAPTTEFALGNGFNSASLTIGPADQAEVPEPSTMLLCAAALAAIGMKRSRR